MYSVKCHLVVVCIYMYFLLWMLDMQDEEGRNSLWRGTETEVHVLRLPVGRLWGPRHHPNEGGWWYTIVENMTTKSQSFTQETLVYWNVVASDLCSKRMARIARVVELIDIMRNFTMWGEFFFYFIGSGYLNNMVQVINDPDMISKKIKWKFILSCSESEQFWIHIFFIINHSFFFFTPVHFVFLGSIRNKQQL